MKALKISIAAILMTVSTVSQAQDITSLATSGVIAGVRWAASHPQQVKWFFTGMDHTWWYCRYQDGFTTWNNFRSYRDVNNVWNYFAMGRGDCDAKYQDQNGNWQHVCYQSSLQAENYVRYHGKIVDIGFQQSNGSNHSILSF